MKKVAVSGGFDPIHIGHLRLLKEAKEIGDHLTVILNSDKFLIEKKGFCFMPFEERKEILLSVAEVDKVVESVDKDQTVIETIKKLSKDNAIDVFANGGDRKDIKDIPEYEVCIENNIKMVFDIGGDKSQSSSDLLKPFVNYFEKRPWGSFENFASSSNYLVKKIVIKPGHKISLQYHNFRKEYWVVLSGQGMISIGNEETKCKSGSFFCIEKGLRHRIENDGINDLEIIEVQLGEKITEDDITRIEDSYGRK